MKMQAKATVEGASVWWHTKDEGQHRLKEEKTA
jgi:hypothetical protein